MEQEIWNALTSSIAEVLPECVKEDITPKHSLRDLGANSVDRAEIIMLALSSLKLKIPLIEFAAAKNLQELVDVFCHSLLRKTSS